MISKLAFKVKQKLPAVVAVAWLPLLLVALFVVQNHVFNDWLGIGTANWQYRSIISAGLATVLFGSAVLFGRRGRYLYLATVSLLVGIIFVAQYLYFSYSGAFLQASSIRYAGYAKAVSGTIKTLITPSLLLFVIGLPVVVVAWLGVKDQRNYRLIIGRRTKLVMLAAGMLVTLFSYGFVLAQEKRQWGDFSRLYSKIYDPADVVRRLGIIHYSLADLTKLVTIRRVSDEDKQLARQWLERVAEPDTGQRRFYGAAKGRNLILIQLESFENFVVGRTISGQEITPNLNRLAAQGLNFSHHYYQAGPGTTADAELVTLNSLYPLTSEVAFISHAHNDFQALPKLLVGQGYATAALHADVKSFWNRANIYPQLGYQRYFDKSDFGAGRQVGWALGDQDFFAQSVPKLQNLKLPFMATLMTMTSHTPFDLPADLKGLNITDPEGLSPAQIKYLQSINYVDRSLGRLIDQLKTAGLYDNSVIAVFGDHKSFITTPNDAAFARFAGFNPADRLAYLRHSQVPLVINVPGTPVVGEITAPTSLLDLYPTLANLLGIETPPSLLGQDALNTSSPVVTKRQGEGIGAIVTDQLSYESASGAFEQGHCRQASGTALPVEHCRPVYDEQVRRLKISDAIIRGNLLALPKR